MLPTDEQLQIINHDPNKNGRVLAGPGTGKSWTSISLMRRLIDFQPEIKIRLLTFTRAATQELSRKIEKQNLDVITPSTIHSFALSLLIGNPEASQLPTPLRIPDSWELDFLIRPDIARRLREKGFTNVRKPMVKKLENELSARWQSLNPRIRLIADMNPQVRNAFVGLWESHRGIFGYTLLAELPFRAANAIEDFDLKPTDCDLLVVDEYQDLNETDIRLIRLIHEITGARVIAIGDDDQSIYGFRMAAPEGILRFSNEFTDCRDYKLTLSHRCGMNILEPATMMIQTVPGRPRKPPLRYKPNSNPGTFHYLRFNNQHEEVIGVADLIKARKLSGVPLGEIVVLVRSQENTWANLLIPELNERGIDAVETGRVKKLFTDQEFRKILAKLHLVVDRTDSLAWWALLKLESGISEQFREYIYSEAIRNQDKFGNVLINLYPEFPNSPTIHSAKATQRIINRIHEEIENIDLNNVELGDTGWGGWVLDFIGRGLLNEAQIELFEEVGRLVPIENGLGYFLGQIEPIVKDLSTQSDSVRIMSMTSSKGITVNTCIVMGVENGIIPHPSAHIEEERRLLYVAMTRATEMCILTFAHRRRGPTARIGTTNINHPRGRSPLLAALPIGQYQDGRNTVDRIMAMGREI